MRPCNVLVSGDGAGRLTDFGAALVGAPPARASRASLPPAVARGVPVPVPGSAPAAQAAQAGARMAGQQAPPELNPRKRGPESELLPEGAGPSGRRPSASSPGAPRPLPGASASLPLPGAAQGPGAWRQPAPSSSHPGGTWITVTTGMPVPAYSAAAPRACDAAGSGRAPGSGSGAPPLGLTPRLPAPGGGAPGQQAPLWEGPQRQPLQRSLSTQPWAHPSAQQQQQGGPAAAAVAAVAGVAPVATLPGAPPPARAASGDEDDWLMGLFAHEGARAPRAGGAGVAAAGGQQAQAQAQARPSCAAAALAMPQVGRGS